MYNYIMAGAQRCSAKVLQTSSQKIKARVENQRTKTEGSTVVARGHGEKENTDLPFNQYKQFYNMNELWGWTE